ncbi:YceI family protein [Marinobacterium maritimum]|uniref:YceI family protein n=1 Tax=Marinobacterium maritimum TaxID=500162 RepID=A0ABN1I785_9GAMM
MKTLTAVILLCLLSSPARAIQWHMDPDSSRLMFEASYQGEPVPGEFRHFQARLTLDPRRTDNAELDVRVDMQSTDLGSSELDEGAATAEWLDITRYPQAEFHSQQIRQVDETQYIATGTLSLKGVERKIELPFRFQEEGQVALMSGEALMQRSWFNIGTGEWSTDEFIGFDVTLSFEVKWQREH